MSSTRGIALSTLLFVAVLLVVLLATIGTASAGTYYVWDDWGGTWADAEKSSDNTEDDDMCWAASSSNVLEWTGWGKVGGLTNTDEMFGYFQDHWTDLGGNPWYAWDWWFDGTNDGPSTYPWSQVDVAGGGFFTGYDIDDYRFYSSSTSLALSNVDGLLHAGYGTTLTVAGPGAHSITVWGFETDGNGDYAGLYVTDSDDDKDGTGTRPNELAYYDVDYLSGKWFLQDFYGTNSWYVSEVVALKIYANPLPSAVWMGLGLMGTLAVLRRHRRRRRVI
jgi:hypothetical protein